jgi:hypothetical protein
MLRSYAYCHYAMARILFTIMLNVIMLSVVKLNVVMLSVVAPNLHSCNVVRNYQKHEIITPQRGILFNGHGLNVQPYLRKLWVLSGNTN